jgi:Fic-DOC domain mobile mystery protein B
MALALEDGDGQTPLDPDEKAGLIPEHLSTQGELNEWEQENLLRAVRWLKRVRSPDVLSEGFCRTLHARMFDQTWDWAGTFRKSDKNIGGDWTQIGVKLDQLFGNTRWWVDNATFGTDEIAARFHRDLVWIHPFPNGNGRHARLMADALLRRLGQPAFSWGNAGSLVAVSEARSRYLSALRAADRGDYRPLMSFVRS